MHSTRELWDEIFFAETWHAMQMGYLRRIQRLIQQHASWLKLSCTEFNYGDDSEIVDAVLTLDALAVYAREGVDLATRWVAPGKESPTAYAYSLLSNYDQFNGSIVDMAYINASSSEPLLGAHGFQAKDGRQVVLLVSRQHTGTMAVSVDLGSQYSGTAHLYRLDADHTKPSEPEQVEFSSGKTQLTMLPAAAGLLVIGTATTVVV